MKTTTKLKISIDMCGEKFNLYSKRYKVFRKSFRLKNWNWILMNYWNKFFLYEKYEKIS